MRRSRNYTYGVLVVSWTAVLLLLGALGYGVFAGINSGRYALDGTLGEVLVSVVVVDSVSSAEVETLSRSIADMPNVGRVRSVSSAESMTQFIAATGHRPMMDVKLPAWIEVRLVGTGVDAADRMAVRLKGDNRVKEVIYDREVIASREKVESGVAASVLYAVCGVGIVLMLLVVTLTGIWAAGLRREVVFSRVFVLGAASGFIAALLLVLGDRYLRLSLGVVWLPGEDILLLASSCQVLVGGLLGLILGYVFKQSAR